jgi:hypothetical protein
MMKTLILRAALACAATIFAMPAHAVVLNAKGGGQALVYPFYTVDNEQNTLVSLVNPGDTGKAVQVSFLEGYLGKHVLDVVVFLKAHDVWTASVSAASNGGAVLRTSDTSCTLPAIPPDGAAFTSTAYDGSAGSGNDGGPTGIDRVREGYITIIAGGDIVAGSPTDVATTHRDDFFGHEIPDCPSLDATGYYADLVPPTGEIFGSGSIVDVGVGTFYAYDADALADFTHTVLLSRFPGTPPDLESANSGRGPNDVDSVVYTDDGTPIALRSNAAIDAVSSVFMASAIHNDYFVDAGLGAHTDFVLTLPTAPFYTASALDIHARAQTTVRDREEGSVPCAPDGPCPGNNALGHAVNVLAVANIPSYAAGTPTGVFGSPLNGDFLAPYGSAGSIDLNFDFDVTLFEGGTAPANQPLEVADANGNTFDLRGIAVTGFMAYNVINANAQPGLLANYGGAFRHHGAFTCTRPVGGCVLPVQP